jgi:hypothetical protein
MTRKYLSEKPLNSMADGSGKETGYLIIGKNTKMHMVYRYQGSDSYNGRHFNRIIVSIDFEDKGLSVTSKFKDSHPNERLLVNYALDLMEDSTYEEYYKAVMILEKNRLSNAALQLKESIAKFERGEYSYITKKNANENRKILALYQDIVDSIDISTKDLKYFEQYGKEGIH